MEKKKFNETQNNNSLKNANNTILTNKRIKIKTETQKGNRLKMTTEIQKDKKSKMTTRKKFKMTEQKWQHKEVCMEGSRKHTNLLYKY